jgi:hypothetical protein
MTMAIPGLILLIPLGGIVAAIFLAVVLSRRSR